MPGGAAEISLAIASVAGISKVSNDWQVLTVKGRGFREGMSVTVHAKPFDSRVPVRAPQVTDTLMRLEVLLKEPGEYEFRVTDGDVSAAKRFAVAGVPSPSVDAAPVPVEPIRVAPATVEPKLPPAASPAPAPISITSVFPGTFRASGVPQNITVNGTGFRPDMASRIVLAGNEIGALAPGTFSGPVNLRVPGTYEVVVGGAIRSFQVLPAAFPFSVPAECEPQRQAQPMLPGSCQVSQFPDLGQAVRADADSGVYVHRVALDVRQNVRFYLSPVRGWPFTPVLALYDPVTKAYRTMSNDTTVSLNPGNYLFFVTSQSKGAGKYSLQITPMGKE